MYQVQAQRCRNQFFDDRPSGIDDRKSSHFYDHIIESLPINGPRNIAFVVVAHLVHTLPPFLAALSKLGVIAAIIPKQSSCVESVVTSIRTLYSDVITASITKELLQEVNNASAQALRKLFTNNPPFNNHQYIILDHGGYFAPQMENLKRFDNILGIVEHTWNGEIRYINHFPNREGAYPASIFSIARTPLKALEDQEVAKSIIHSIHGKVLSAEGMNQDISRLHIGIVGFGHLGKSIALRLKKESLRHHIRIVDLKPEAQEEARKSGFYWVSDRIEDIATESDLVIIATSSQAFTANVFSQLKSDVCLVCVTSSDDLFTETALKDFDKDLISTSATVSKYVHKTTGKVIFIAANGGSVNFLIGSTPHPILHAVLASVYVSVVRLIQNHQLPKFRIHSIDGQDQQRIQKIFEQDYGKCLPPTPEESWGLPDNPIDFIGRKSMLEHLKKTFETQHRQYIFGVEGVGKTTLATKFAHMALQKGDYQYVLWINAESIDSLSDGFRDYLSHDKTEPEPTHDCVNAAYTRLVSFYNKVLIIFNNASDMKTLERFLPDVVTPRNHTIHYLVMTSNPQFSLNQNILELKPFSREEACDYIKTRLAETTDKPISDLASYLNDLPLALNQATEIIRMEQAKSHKTSIEDYIFKSNFRFLMANPLFISHFVLFTAFFSSFIGLAYKCFCTPFQNLNETSPHHYLDFVTNCTYTDQYDNCGPEWGCDLITTPGRYRVQTCPEQYNLPDWSGTFFITIPIAIFGAFASIAMELVCISGILWGLYIIMGEEKSMKATEILVTSIRTLIGKVTHKIIFYPYLDGLLLLASARNLWPDTHDNCDKTTREFQYYTVYAQLFVSILRSQAGVVKGMQFTKTRDLSLEGKQKILGYNLSHYYAQILLSILAVVSIALITRNTNAESCFAGKIIERIVYAGNIISALSRRVIYKQEHKLSIEDKRSTGSTVRFFSEEDDNHSTETCKIRLDRHE